MTPCPRKCMCLLVAPLLVLLVNLGGHAALAQPPDPIESARDSLGSGSNPWYDVEHDSLRRIEIRDVERRPLGLGWLFKWLVYLGLALMIAAIVYLLIRFVMEQAQARRSIPEAQPSAPLVEEAEALPFLAERPRDNLLGQAQRHYEQGNYSEAIIYLFSYELIELDKHARIHLAKGKTNRQYLRELRDLAPLQAMLERTLHAFEGVFFGSRELDRKSFEACWRELPRFQAQLRGAT